MNKTEKLFALTGCANYSSNPGAGRSTLPEQISSLEIALIRSDGELTAANGEVARLKAKEQDIDARATQKAIEIAASQGATWPVNADTDKTAGKGGTQPANGGADPLDTVAAYYRQKYGIN